MTTASLPLIFLLSVASGTLATTSAQAASTETLWHDWYLVSVKGSAVGLYEETVEKRGSEKQVAATQKWTEKTSGPKLAETYIGSVGEDETLAPVAFYVDRKGEKSYKIDGRAKSGQLEITFKPASAETAKTTEHTPLKGGTFLASLVPLAIAKNFKNGGAFSFTTIVEDDGDMNVTVKKGMAEIQKTEKKIGKESCRQVKITIDGKNQDWWIAKNGKTCLVNFPDSGAKLELSDEKNAKKAVGVP